MGFVPPVGVDLIHFLELGVAIADELLHALGLGVEAVVRGERHLGLSLRLIATLHDLALIPKILAHLGIATSGPSPGPAPPEPGAAASWSIPGRGDRRRACATRRHLR